MEAGNAASGQKGLEARALLSPVFENLDFTEYEQEMKKRKSQPVNKQQAEADEMRLRRRGE